MSKRHYRAWTPSKEQDYPSWVVYYLHLTWPERARKYSIKYKPRIKESLWTKYQLLEKDIRQHCYPICKIPSRLRHNPSPLRIRMIRLLTSTYVALPQNHGQTAQLIQGPKSTVQSLAKCAHRRGFKTHWVHKAYPIQWLKQSDVLTIFFIAGNEKDNGIPSRSLNAPSKIDLLWQLIYHVSGRTRQ
ncbi:uncharacterized protein BO88DRAFT_427262 [Aspergillus vadensis CBS 113365]|uniref:Uncharacterized protein n=1 Tax=Aspergillus vadensis (strain CBS 113365 / IMI 142717 / IBT 24658) TaxID=1448311 RepID=A0A319B5L3_ASPVC|nr:hypothetical protein BO88DRAFT_427262 [Aspergillus vadensis CBS 113365]PYH67094.1 hypothetical protein BO88DRAFT_427262 [Aspergillus vadensis CBS 113365]